MNLNSNKKLLSYLLGVLFIASPSSNLSAAKKPDSTSLFNILPAEIYQTIESFLPQKKIPSLSRRIMHHYSEKEYTKLFKHYLMYPMPVQGKEKEQELINLLNSNIENKKLFYSLLLQEAHPNYFENVRWIEWRGLFEINRKRVNLAKDKKSYIEIIYLNKEKSELLSKNNINKIVRIHFDTFKKMNFDKVFTSKKILKRLERKDRIKESDNIRIIFSQGDGDANLINLNFIFLLAKELFEGFKTTNFKSRAFLQARQKDQNIVKIVDVTLIDRFYFKYEINRSFFDIANQIGCPVYMSIQNTNFSGETFIQFMKQYVNIKIKPYYIISNIFKNKKQELMNEDVVTYLCEQGFHSFLAKKIIDLPQSIDFFINEQIRGILKIVTRYVSPRALILPGNKNFLEGLFELHASGGSIDEFIVYAHNYDIDINSYYSKYLNGTFLTYLIEKFPCINPLKKIEKLISTGVDIFFRFNDQTTILERFFLNLDRIGTLGTFRNKTNFFAYIGGLKVQRKSWHNNYNQDFIQQKKQQYKLVYLLLDGQKKHKISNDININTKILFTYFQYANCFNASIIDMLLKKGVNLNTQNAQNQTLYQNLIKFIMKITENDGEFYITQVSFPRINRGNIQITNMVGNKVLMSKIVIYNYYIKQDYYAILNRFLLKNYLNMTDKYQNSEYKGYLFL